MKTLLRSILDAVVPPRSTERLVARLSLDDLLVLGGGDPLPYHDPRVTALVWELKYYNNTHARALAGAYLADQLLALAAEEIGTPLLVPVPIHKNRRKKRGHNQTELLCQAALSTVGETGFTYHPTALVRAVDTKHQQGLPRHIRLKNVHRSMEAVPEVAGRVCIVVDDVTTTGATLAEAERALQAVGARAVHPLTLAKS